MSSVVAIFSQTLNDALCQDFSIFLPDVKPQTLRDLDGPNAGSRHWYEQSGRWSLTGCLLELLQPRMCATSQDTFLPLLLQTFLSVETGNRLLSLNTNQIYNSASKFNGKKLGQKFFGIVGGLHYDFGQVFVYEWFLKSLAPLIHLLIEAYDSHLLQLGRKRLATQEKENRQARRRKVVSAPRPKAALLGRVTPIQTAAQPNARPSPIVSQVMTKVCATDEARGSTPPSVSASIPELSIDRLISKKPFLKAISTTLATTKRMLRREMRDFAWTASGGSIENIPSRRASTHARRTGLASRWSPGALPDLSVSTSASSTSTASPRTPVNVLSTRKPTDLAKDLPSVLCTPPHITTCTFGDDISPVPRPQE